MPLYPRVCESRHVDVIVVGGGMTGLTTAFLLKRAGKSVCVLERDTLGSGDTGNTSAHLTAITDRRLSELVNALGRDAAALTWQAGYHAIDLIERTVEDENISCEFRRLPAFLCAALQGAEDETASLGAEAALARDLGFDLEFVARAPIVNRPGIQIAKQAKFQAFDYLAALAKLVEGEGCSIYEQSEVTQVEGDDPIAVMVNDVELRCHDLVIATHVPIVGKTNLLKAALFQSKLTQYSSYVLSGSLPRGRFSEICLWDTSNPYFYLRIDRDLANAGGHEPPNDRFIFGGNDHKTGQMENPEDCYRRLEQSLKEILPEAKVDSRWSGQLIATSDGLPLIGEMADHQYVATGFNGNGLTFGTIAALIIRDAILGQANPWQELFSIRRNTAIRGAWDYIKQNLDYPYYMAADWLAGPEAGAPTDLKPGEGRILKVNGKRVACSRDDDGVVHSVSAVCTHLGCIVHWNNAERTWDCPCHGSRFAPTGDVIAGPAEAPLESVDPVAAQE
jgi:glycine/D-amino acid oxidase-like deaminating enzyme/nitrite reductase/ring-hydroxylating ferredoxin subunit